MNPNYNLPPGVTLKQIDPPDQNACEECGEPLETDQEHYMGLCAEHLRIVVEGLPE